MAQALDKAEVERTLAELKDDLHAMVEALEGMLTELEASSWPDVGPTFRRHAAGLCGRLKKLGIAAIPLIHPLICTQCMAPITDFGKK